MQGRDAQSSDRDLAVPRRGDRLGRRDPRRGRDRSRRKTQSRARRFHRVAPAHSGRARPLGSSDEWIGTPTGSRTALDIMIDGPLGAAAFNNEFGRPAIRRLLPHVRDRGGDAASCAAIDKPIMLAGGIGAIRAGDVAKTPIAAGARARRARRPGVADRPRRRRGVSVAQGAQRRGSRLRVGAARQRRDRATLPGSDRSLLGAGRAQSRSCRIHDVGAGGLSNAIPELVHDAGVGATLDLRAIPTDEPAFVAARDLVQRSARALRARDRARASSTTSPRFAPASACPFAVLGIATAERPARARRRAARSPATAPIDMPMDVVLGKPPQMQRDPRASVAARAAVVPRSRRHRHRAMPRRPRAAAARRSPTRLSWSRSAIAPSAACARAIRWSVRGKSRSPTARSRSTTSTVTRAKPWRSANARRSRCSIARRRPRASRSARRSRTSRRRRSAVSATSSCRANWMAAAGHPGEDAGSSTPCARRASVPALGIAIPVGKDSLSMRTQWDGKAEKSWSRRCRWS